MSKKNIYVFDDDQRFANQYATKLDNVNAIKRSFKVEPLDSKTFEKELTILQERRYKIRTTNNWNEGSLFDETSVLIIDYDLLKALKPPLFITGEIVAYLVRCFSKCGIIIGLNQFGVNPFDLTLRGNLESYSDLNIGARQLHNPGLWGNEKDEFRPWYWPLIPQYLDKFEKKIKKVMENPTESIFDAIGLTKLLPYLPRSVSEFVKTKQASITFDWFAKHSGNGIKGRKEKILNEEMIARISVSRLSKWIERYILQGQDIVVDAPHLVSRYPSLLRGDVNNINSWNKTALFRDPKYLGIDYRKLEKYRMKKTEWFSRPVWIWNELMNESSIKEVESPWEKISSDYVFCEDASSFNDYKNCREFTCETDSPFVFRYLKYFKGIEYRPRVRLV